MDPSEQPVTFDNVLRPKHYNQDEGIECIDAMIAAFGLEAIEAYCLAAAFKYLWRAGHKGTKNEDLSKAIWYLRFAAGDDPRKVYKPKGTP
jgi:hypothetical protein